MSDFNSLPSLRAALQALHDVIANPPLQPEFHCPFCGKLERSGHPCSSATDLDAERRTLEALDAWVRGR